MHHPNCECSACEEYYQDNMSEAEWDREIARVCEALLEEGL
jgi:hypothetical protein